MPVRRHLRPTVVIATIVLVIGVAWIGQRGGQRAAASGPSAPFRTAWGDPDLQGYWSYATVTPLERPDAQADKEFLTAEEASAVNQEAASRGDRRSADPKQDVEAAY